MKTIYMNKQNAVATLLEWAHAQRLGQKVSPVHPFNQGVTMVGRRKKGKFKNVTLRYKSAGEYPMSVELTLAKIAKDNWMLDGRLIIVTTGANGKPKDIEFVTHEYAEQVEPLLDDLALQYSGWLADRRIGDAEDAIESLFGVVQASGSGRDLEMLRRLVAHWHEVKHV